MTNTVAAKMNFLPAALAGGPVYHTDFRTPAEEPESAGSEASEDAGPTEVAVMNAHEHVDAGLHVSGFELVHSPSAVTDFYDCELVMDTYYSECKAIAQKLTGAHTTFTFDHIIREPGQQYSGGGIDGSMRKTGVERGGGYIGSVHMDYTDNTTWDKYLALHGERVPEDVNHVYALNFWRPLSPSVDDNPLAVCDARSVQVSDLLETVVYGYGAENYSWHDIGIETFSVSAAEHQRWYYYPGMTPDDVLVIKSFDTDGVIGTTCPHASFAHPNPKGEPRRSIELRVLCFC
ncbi:MAG: hypothetical protein HOK91_16430 [Gammaproteobacteria bacterium]|jgi:hypothetical protein|nr:hypothetical protein [Gammaproteobacteria bacterium]